MPKSARIVLVFIAGLAVVAGLLALGGSRVAAQDANWYGEYFTNPDLSGRPQFTRPETNIDFNWWDGSPAPSIPSNYFSARWSKNMYFNNGAYRFAATMDDGMRVYVDGQLIIDSWYPSVAHTISKDVNMTAGTHRVVVEYFEAQGQASAGLTITQVGGFGGSGGTGGSGNRPGGGDGGDPGGAFPNWKGEYFSNQTVSGAPVYVRDDRYIDFNWQKSSPVPGVVPADRFSVRWTRTGNYPAGQYKLRLTSDDGSRLWINNQVVLDNWSRPTLQPVEVNYWFPGGPATIRVDYYDVSGPASVRLDVIQVPGGGGVRPPSGYPDGGFGGSGGTGGSVGGSGGTGGSVGGSGGTGGGFGGSGGTGGSVGGSGGTGGTGGSGSTNPIAQCPGVAYPTGLAAVVVSPTNLNVRRTPSTLSEIMGQYAPCATISLTGHRDVTGQWVETTLNGVPGWVTTQYLITGVPVNSMTVK